MDARSTRCEALARYGQCKQECKYEHQGYRFCGIHFTRLKKKGFVKVLGRRGFVAWKDEEVE